MSLAKSIADELLSEHRDAESAPAPVRLADPEPLAFVVARLQRELQDERASRLFFQSMLTRVVERIANRVRVMEAGK